MNAVACPDQDVLEAYVLGHCDARAIDAHLDDCPACRAALDRLESALLRPFAAIKEPPQTMLDWSAPAYCRLVADAKALQSSPDDLTLPHTLGNYQLLELIGSGGMGRVYRAVHQRLKKTVAVKLVAPGLVRTPEVRQRFHREMEAVGRLTSPHIVTAHDAAEADGRDFLVMEFVEGETLSQIVQDRGPMTIHDALDATLQAARGLDHAHSAGIVHRDVKPGNLLRTADGSIKVLDLGLASFQSGESNTCSLTATGNAIMGTAAFMAPEQAIRSADADERADVYSLGCTLFFLLTGKFPYDADTAMGMLAAHRERPTPSVRVQRGECPAAVDAFVGRMLAKKPHDRPATMKQVIAELQRLQEPTSLRTAAPGSGAARRFVLGLIAASILLPAMGLALWFSGAFAGNPKQNADGPGFLTPRKDATPMIELASIPAGKFFMGASDSDKHASANEKPRREIKINHAFFLGKTEITQAQYEEVMGTNPAAFSKKGQHRERVKDMDKSKHPVESVSWLDAVRFCNRLSERHGLQPYYKIAGDVVTIKGGTGYRLPTEAEWEYACRADTTSTWHFGENQADLKDHAWFDANSGDRTHPVGEKKANSFGLFDMYGNVPEWCWDRYDAEYYKDAPSSDPPGAGVGRYRVYRGGAWNTVLPRTSARVALGLTYGAEGSPNIIGFRVARTAE
jgi:formylglycine-generating enzyme required for sulfatase activity/tRNA A-37 threonylcarbamoyl transferase component Bud32